MSILDYRLPPLYDDAPADATTALAEVEANVMRVFHELSDEIAALKARLDALERAR